MWLGDLLPAEICNNRTPTGAITCPASFPDMRIYHGRLLSPWPTQSLGRAAHEWGRGALRCQIALYVCVSAANRRRLSARATASLASLLSIPQQLRLSWPLAAPRIRAKAGVASSAATVAHALAGTANLVPSWRTRGISAAPVSRRSLSKANARCAGVLWILEASCNCAVSAARTWSLPRSAPRRALYARCACRFST